jgi:cellulose synthase/poly-beta-1,6-N-acetylglucosamine synthase-like glycosyltransferase
VTIYDADDRPDPLQLKKAAWMFRELPESYVCLQARLNYYNAEDNLLTRFFALEYHSLFDVQLKGLERLGIPIPLGGTSNHLHLGRLRELGEWDPYNVTEDADLGVRITTRGYRTAMLDSDTMEEAPIAVGAWLKQRSRWIKGYMQTWLVHMRNPTRLFTRLGAKSFTGFQFFVGLSTFTFLSAPLVWGVSLGWWAVEGSLPGSVAVLTLSNLVLYFISSWWFTLRALRGKHASRALRRAALLYPLYLVLHSVASYKALWQLIVKPHYWEKTMHGLTRRAPPVPPVPPVAQAA